MKGKKKKSASEMKRELRSLRRRIARWQSKKARLHNKIWAIERQLQERTEGLQRQIADVNGLLDELHDRHAKIVLSKEYFKAVHGRERQDH